MFDWFKRKPGSASSPDASEATGISEPNYVAPDSMDTQPQPGTSGSSIDPAPSSASGASDPSSTQQSVASVVVSTTDVMPSPPAAIDLDARQFYEGRERQYLEQLRDKRIYGVPVIWDVIEDWHGCVCLVTDYIPGVSLQSKINEMRRRGQRFTEEDVIDFLKRITIILLQLHYHAEMLHRDIKPENIMVLEGRGGRREYFLIDFGVASTPEPNRLTMAGTKVYAPDEQANDGKPVDASDIFSLGLTAVEMFLGVLPNRADMHHALDSQEAVPTSRLPKRVLRLRTGLSHKLRRILHTMLMQSHRQRYQTAFELWRDLMLTFPDDNPLDEDKWGDAEEAVKRSIHVVRKYISLLDNLDEQPPPRFTYPDADEDELEPTGDGKELDAEPTTAGDRRPAGLPDWPGTNLLPRSRDSTNSLEAELILPDGPELWDPQALVHVVRLAIYEEVNSAGASVELRKQVLRTSLRVGSVKTGSTKILLNLDLDSATEEGPILQRIKCAIQRLGVLEWKVKKKRADAWAGFLHEKLNQNGKSIKKKLLSWLGWGDSHWMPKEAAKKNRELLHAVKSKQKDEQHAQPNSRAIYLYASQANFKDMGSFDQPDRDEGIDKACSEISSLLGSDSGVADSDFVHFSEIISLDNATTAWGSGSAAGAASSARPVVGPALAIAIVKALGGWQGTIADSLGNQVAELVESIGEILQQQIREDGQVPATVFECVKEVLVADSSSSHDWRRRVQWHNLSQSGAQRLRLSSGESAANCFAVEIGDLDQLISSDFSRNNAVRDVLSKAKEARVTLWILGLPLEGTVNLVLRVSHPDDKAAIRRCIQDKTDLQEEEIQPGNEEGGEAGAADARPYLVVAEFSNEKFSFNYMLSDVVYDWNKLVEVEALDRDMKVNIVKIKGTRKSDKSVVLLYSSEADKKAILDPPRSLIELDAEDRNGEFVVTLHVDGTLKLPEAVSAIKAAEIPPAFSVFPSQRQVARTILERATYILTGTTDVHELSKKFRDFHFIVLMPRYTSLQNQTRNRMVQAGLVSAEDAENQVFMFMDSQACKSAYAAFKKRAIEEPDTLCVLVADECHWGVGRGSAHDSFVNDSNVDSEYPDARLTDCENVLVLLVSATPGNVLTKKSRIPEKYRLKEETIARVLQNEADSGVTETLEAKTVVEVVKHAKDGVHVRRDGDSSNSTLLLEFAALKDVPEVHVVKWDQVMQEMNEVEAAASRTSGDPIPSVVSNEAAAVRYNRVTEFVESVATASPERRDIQDDPFFIALLTKYHRTLGHKCQSKAERKKYCDTDILAADYAFSSLFRRHFINCAPRPAPRPASAEFDAAASALYKHFWEIFKGDTSLELVGNVYLSFISKEALKLSLAGAKENQAETLTSNEASVDEFSVSLLKPYLDKKLRVFQSPSKVKGCRLVPEQPFLYTQTDWILEDLLNVQNNVGRMKMVRADDNKTAMRFKDVLMATRRICRWTSAFEIIADFGNAELEDAITAPFQRRYIKRRGAAAGESRLTYEDLESMPCILILCEKGRMGDTFPRSFNTMDLRCRHGENTGAMTSFIQEIGRMCRYAPGNSPLRPYAVVGKKLFKQIQVAIERHDKQRARDPNAPKHVIDYLRLKEFDSYAKGSARTYSRTLNPRTDLEPLKSYDVAMQKHHTRRLLLEAEPQIGKTGTYSYFLLLVREFVTRPLIQPPVPLSGQATASYKQPPQDWKRADVFAHRARLLQNSTTLGAYVKEIVEELGPREILPAGAFESLKALYDACASDASTGTVVRGGRCLNVEKLRELLDFDKRLNLASIDLSDMKAAEKTLREPVELAKRDAASSKQRPPCLLTAVAVEIAPGAKATSKPNSTRYVLAPELLKRIGVPDDCIGQVTISIPSNSVGESVSGGSGGSDGGGGGSGGSGGGDGDGSGDSGGGGGGGHRRFAFVVCGDNPVEARLGVAGDHDIPANLLAVVCKPHFEAYASIWGGRVAILSIPERLKLPDWKSEARAPSGPVGFARLFVLLFSCELKLDFIWLFDDSVAGCREKPLGEAMRDVEKRVVAAGSSGPAVAGFSHEAPSAFRASEDHDFSITPYVYGAFFLNVDLLNEKRWLYPAKRHWSEVDFHFRCQAQGSSSLLVWRFESLHIVIALRERVSLFSQPTMCRWTPGAGCVLTSGGPGAEPPDHSQLDILIPWLSDRVGSGLLLGCQYNDREVQASEFVKSFAAAAGSKGMELKWKSHNEVEVEDVRRISTGTSCTGVVFFPNPISWFSVTSGVPIWMWDAVKSPTLIVVVPRNATVVIIVGSGTGCVDCARIHDPSRVSAAATAASSPSTAAASSPPTAGTTTPSKTRSESHTKYKDSRREDGNRLKARQRLVRDALGLPKTVPSKKAEAASGGGEPEEAGSAKKLKQGRKAAGAKKQKTTGSGEAESVVAKKSEGSEKAASKAADEEGDDDISREGDDKDSENDD
eukprot:tig00020629_g12336.t1